MTSGKLAVKFPHSRGKICESPREKFDTFYKSSQAKEEI